MRGRQPQLWKHLIAPGLGFAILFYVVINAKVAAQTLGFVWLAIGVVVCSSYCSPPVASPTCPRVGHAETENA